MKRLPAPSFLPPLSSGVSCCALLMIKQERFHGTLMSANNKHPLNTMCQDGGAD